MVITIRENFMTKWTGIEFDNFTKVPTLESYESNCDGLFFKCDFDGQKKTIFFEYYFSLRYIEEGNAFTILHEQDFDGQTWLYINESSDLSDWFNSQSYEAHKDNFKAYVLVTLDEIIEVLSYKPPVLLDNTD